MKKIFISFLALGIINSANALDLQVLTGDAKLACEAILCLSSPTTPAECMPALRKYFSIGNVFNAIKARKGFLSLCPVANESKEMKNQIDSLSRITGSCTIEELNANIEMKKDQEITTTLTNEEFLEYTKQKKYNFVNGTIVTDILRVNPKMTKNCQILSSMSYSAFNFKYTCDGQFYTKEEWDRGFTIQKQKISKSEYNSLKNSEREMNNIPNGKGGMNKVYYKYKKIPINKNCWVNE